MLQIISGKFFKTEDRHKFDGKGITYSNYSWIKPIKTCVATLEPVDYFSPVTSYVISYIYQIEKDKDGRSRTVRVGDAEIIRQFELLASFALKAYFSETKVDVECKCRNIRKSMGGIKSPSLLVRHFFDTPIHGKLEETEHFVNFVQKVIALPRNRYKAVLRCIYNFVNALQSVDVNLDLSYSILVYCLESLAQEFDDFKPGWIDYDPDIRDKLDSELCKIDIDVAENVRMILSSSQNLKLQQRFLTFVCNHTNSNYFIKEAEKVENPLKKSEMERALKNAYSLRSRYVHNLKQIIRQLEIPHVADGDVFHWKNEPYLTINGLVNLTHHVINNFIWQQSYLEHEEYNWKKDLPGIYEFEIAPQNWIWKHENFKPSMACKRYSGFLQNLEDAISSKGSLTDLDKLLEKYESLIPNAKKKDKLSMLAVYYLYNTFIEEKGKCLNYEKFLSKYENLFNECCIEMLIVKLLLNKKWPWSVEECVKQYDQYVHTKFSKNSLSIPQLIEVCLIAEIANAYLEKQDIENYEKWLDNACLESAGKQKIQKFINESKLKKIEIDYNQILKLN